MNISVAGYLVTGTWLVALPVYVLHFMGWEKFAAMSPNEFGDFLAGAAAPLAFFWLVIGYLQQGKQLRLQRLELELQRNELELQRKETERLANEAAKQASSIAANELHARKDTFFRFAEMVSSEQQSIGGDLYEGIFGTNSVHGWVQVSNGDIDYFYRSILRRIFSQDVEVTKAKFQANTALGQCAEKFKNNFRNLITEAEKCDSERNIIRQYEFGWMGNLYAGLCFLIDGPCEFRIRKQPSGPEDIM